MLHQPLIMQFFVVLDSWHVAGTSDPPLPVPPIKVYIFGVRPTDASKNIVIRKHIPGKVGVICSGFIWIDKIVALKSLIFNLEPYVC